MFCFTNLFRQALIFPFLLKPRQWFDYNDSPDIIQMQQRNLSFTRNWFHCYNRPSIWPCLEMAHFLRLIDRDRVTHTCVNKLGIPGSDNGLPDMIKINVGVLLHGSFGTNGSAIWIEIRRCLYYEITLKTSAPMWPGRVCASGRPRSSLVQITSNRVLDASSLSRYQCCAV